MTVSERMRLIPFETIVGLSLALSSFLAQIIF